MSRQEYELEQLADEQGMEVYRQDSPHGGRGYYYRVKDIEASGLPADFNNHPIGPFHSYLEALKFATNMEDS